MAVDKTTITVERIGKFGVMSGGIWFGLSSMSGLKISDFSPMTSYDVLVYTSDSGKKYINQIVGSGNTVTSPTNTALKAGDVPASFHATSDLKPGDDKLLAVIKEEKKSRVTGEVDWDKKNAQIRAQGTIQAAVNSPALQMFAVNYDEWIALVEKTAKFELDFISKNS